MAAPQQLSPIFGLPRRVGLVVGAVLVADQATKALAQQLAAPDAPGWLQPVHNPDVLMSVYSDTPALLVAVGLVALIGFSVHLLHLARGGSRAWARTSK